MGAPSLFTQDIADEICERLSNGESLRAICRGDHMPDKATVFRWITARPEFEKQYALAREAQAETLFDDILEIADDGRNDTYLRDGVEVVNNENIQRSRLRVDTRKWMAGKMKPKKYGERLELAGDKENPIHIVAGARVTLGAKLDRIAHAASDGGDQEQPE